MNGVSKFSFDRHTFQSFERGAAFEWLETNGIGGWASSTINGAHTRRYHGLLVAAVKPPHERQVLLSKLDETIQNAHGRFELGSNRFPGAIAPEGFRFISNFSKELFPSWEFEVPGARLKKTVVCVHGENTTVVLYEVLESDGEFTFELRPFIAARDYHSLTHANDAINRSAVFKKSVLELPSYQGVPSVFLAAPGIEFREEAMWYYNFEYSWEAARGLDTREDLFTHGVLSTQLRKGSRFGVLVSTDPVGKRDAFALFAAEKKRREEVLARVPVRDGFAQTLALAADQFIVSREDGLKTIIAGYHWFADWGRDTMIALPGLCLTTGRAADAKQILRAFAKAVSQGMLPNRFTDDGSGAEYNSVDASLWFFVAVHYYLAQTGDLAFIEREILPALREIQQGYEKGTRYGIHQSAEGLLYAGEPGVQLTWMDAKVGDQVITPRIGAPVEINALWYNALRILAELEEQVGVRREAVRCRKAAERVKEAFLRVFWNEELECLFDCINGAAIDAAVRPNQLFAISLPHPLLSTGRARKVLQIIEERLYTPVGLRSLDPQHPDYRGRYDGDVWSRDSAYHQGTVWSWLLGPYITALVRFGGAEGRRKAAQAINEFRLHLSEAGIGTVSEIFDGDAPYTPQGCIAQAWGVAEVLRAYVDDVCQVKRDGNEQVDGASIALN